MFVPEHPIAGLRGAEYNPRAIADDAIDVLEQSIRRIGMAKPVICTRDGLIIAGHQRTRAMRQAGIAHCPAYILDDVSPQDQIRFNQLHNGTDMEIGTEECRMAPSTATGYEIVEPEAITGNARGRGAYARANICRLIGSYGPWGAVVATHSGVVVNAGAYAMASKILKVPCRVYRIPDAMLDEALAFFGRSYGTFSYRHLDPTPWAQTMAQPWRMRSAKHPQLSYAYEKCLRPILKRRPETRVLDFGCGQGDYLRKLQGEHVNIEGVEFWYRKGLKIDPVTTRKLIDSTLASLARYGRFDVVMCEFVLNSTHSDEAERAVCACLNALCKPGGRIYFSGRERKLVHGYERQTSTVSTVTDPIKFLDETGRSAVFLDSMWFYQKFHTDDQIRELSRRYFNADKDPVIFHHSGFHAWTVKAVALPDDEVEAALRFEFDLAWPDGESVGRGEQAVAAWRAAIAKETETTR